MAKVDRLRGRSIPGHAAIRNALLELRHQPVVAFRLVNDKLKEQTPRN